MDILRFFVKCFVLFSLTVAVSVISNSRWWIIPGDMLLIIYAMYGWKQLTENQSNNAYKIHIGKLNHYQSLQEVLNSSPTEFEFLSGELLLKQGLLLSCKRVGGAGDLGADLIGHDKQGKKVIVQCKRYAIGNKVGSPELQKFMGMIQIHHMADYGIFITSSEYSSPAKELAGKHKELIKLVDGQEIAKWFEENKDS